MRKNYHMVGEYQLKDWDDMLNAIEPCAYRNHQSHDCHIELGKIAGKS